MPWAILLVENGPMHSDQPPTNYGERDVSVGELLVLNVAKDLRAQVYLIERQAVGLPFAYARRF